MNRGVVREKMFSNHETNQYWLLFNDMHKGEVRANMFSSTSEEITKFEALMALNKWNAVFDVSVFELFSNCFKTW